MADLEMSRFRSSLVDPDEFTVTLELVPSRGVRGTAQDRVIRFAEEAALDGRMQAVSITENAGGHPALSPEVLGLEIMEAGLDVIIHLSCKDKNRNQMESLLLAWDRAGLKNLLVIAGDYPQQGYRGHPKPVFDLDTVHALDLIGHLNSEHDRAASWCPDESDVESTSFYKGVAVSPFKYSEAEQIGQYYKLHRKASAGADYVITQVGYDLRKFHELIQYIQMEGPALPVLGNVFIPTPFVAKLMNEGKIPGVVLSDRLYEVMSKEFSSSDKGRKASLARGAKLLCVLKGLGYSGVHIGGPGLSFSEVDNMLTDSERWEDSWPEFLAEFSDAKPPQAVNPFYYYLKDDEKGLNSLELSGRRKFSWSFPYAFSCGVHDLAFTEEGLLYDIAKKTCQALVPEDGGGLFHRIEHLTKLILVGCKDCGDCTLSDLAYMCPQSGCAKYLLNGPCGGSSKSWCEVFPGRKRCFYVGVYERLANEGRVETLKKGFVPPRDWSLSNTSAWANFFAGRDHHKQRK